MLNKAVIASITAILGILVLMWAMQVTAGAQKAAVPKPQNTLALGEEEVKQLLLLIDTNNNGKITKKEWMTFMEAEFDRLDKNKTGQLDPKELAESRVQASHFLAAGK